MSLLDGPPEIAVSPLQMHRASRTERDGVLATLFFQVAHYALRPWPWIITGLATVVLYPNGYHMLFRDLAGGLSGPAGCNMVSRPPPHQGPRRCRG